MYKFCKDGIDLPDHLANALVDACEKRGVYPETLFQFMVHDLLYDEDKHGLPDSQTSREKIGFKKRKWKNFNTEKTPKEGE